MAQEWIPGGTECFGKLYVMCDQASRVVASHTLRRLRVHTHRDGSQGDTLIAKTERIQTQSDEKRIHFGFPPAPRSGDIVVRAEGLCKSYPTAPLTGPSHVDTGPG